MNELKANDPISNKPTINVKSSSGVMWWVIGGIVLFITHLVSFGGGAYVQTQRLKPNADQLASTFNDMKELSEENKKLKAEGQKRLDEFNKKLGITESDLADKKSTIDILNDRYDYLVNNPERKEVVRNVCVGGKWTGVSQANAIIAERNRLNQESGRLK